MIKKNPLTKKNLPIAMMTLRMSRWTVPTLAPIAICWASSIHSGCASTEPDGSGAEDQQVVLATVALSDSEKISFVEVSPGVTVLQQEGGSEDLARSLVTRDLVSASLIDQYRRVSGSNTVPKDIETVLDAAQQRRSVLRSRIQSGEIAPPPRQAPTAPLVPQYADHVVVFDFMNNHETASDYYTMDCPSPPAFSEQWCFDLPAGDWGPGWDGNTVFWRSTTFRDAGASSYNHIIWRWNGSSWVQVWHNTVGTVNNQVYSLYATDFPFMTSEFFVNGGNGAHIHAAVVHQFP